MSGPRCHLFLLTSASALLLRGAAAFGEAACSEGGGCEAGGEGDGAALLQHARMHANVNAHVNSDSNATLMDLWNPCGSKAGIFYKFDDGKSESIDWTDAFAPLKVKDHSCLKIAVCNWASRECDDEALADILPPLVDKVGEKASVEILVSNSANLNVKGTLIVGDKRIKGKPWWTGQCIEEKACPTTCRGRKAKRVRRKARRAAKRERNKQRRVEKRLRAKRLRESPPKRVAALLPTLIEGKIKRDATIKISVQNSANVYLKEETSELQVRDGNLVNQLVFNDPGNKLRGAKVTIEVSDSANVKSTCGSGSGGLVRLRGESSLFGGSLFSEKYEDVALNLKLTKSANVVSDALELQYKDNKDDASPSLVHHVVDMDLDSDVGKLTLSKVHVKMDRVANFKGKQLWSEDSGNAFIRRAVGGGVVTKSIVDVAVNKVSRVTASCLVHLDNSELLDKVLEVDKIKESDVDIKVSDSCGVETPRLKLLKASRIVDELVDQPDVVSSKIKVSVDGLVNINGGWTTISSSLALDELVYFESSKADSSVKIRLHDSANWRGRVLDILNDNDETPALLQDVFDVEDNVVDTTVDLDVDKVANAKATSLICVNEGELFNDGMDSDDVKKSTVSVSISNSGNAKAPKVHMEGNCFDDAFDADEVVNSKVTVKADNCANVETDSLKIKDSDLLDTLVEIDDKIKDSHVSASGVHLAEVKASTVTLIDEARLIESGIQTSDTVKDSTVKLRLEDSANIVKATATLRKKSSLIHGAILADQDESTASKDLRFEGLSTKIKDSGNLHKAGKGSKLSRDSALLGKLGGDIALQDLNLKLVDSGTSCASLKISKRSELCKDENIEKKAVVFKDSCELKGKKGDDKQESSSESSGGGGR